MKLQLEEQGWRTNQGKHFKVPLFMESVLTRFLKTESMYKWPAKAISDSWGKQTLRHIH